jgi:hypothetical protein
MVAVRRTLNRPPSRRRRSALRWLAVAAIATGCMGPILRPQSPDPALTEAALRLQEQDSQPGQPRLVGSVAHPYGLSYMKVENVAMVTGLAGTGEDPAPSPQRAALLAEMNRREIENPNEVLASPNTSLVLVRALLKPGIKEGEKFDVDVRTPSRSDTTSLRGGWLLETRLSEVAVLGGQLRKGHESALAQGPILVDPSADVGHDEARAIHGRILSGGVCTKSRELGLILDHDKKSFRVSQSVGKAVNERFYTYIDGKRQGVATPKTDEFISLVLHPRYKDNVARYMRVVRSIALDESATSRMNRVKLLREQLLDPLTAETAALRLEGLGGDDAIEILKEGVASQDREVRFYSAESLAYLDVTEGVDALKRAAIEEPAFRVGALTALGAMDDGAAAEALTEMLGVRSAETRYGAFRALTQMAPDDPLVRGENMAGKFKLHTLDVTGPDMVHVTASHHPEIVLFGKDHALHLPLMLDAGQRIKINGLSGDRITVSRFGPGEPTQQRQVEPTVEAVIRAVVDLGGDYPDVVQLLAQAKDMGALKSRFRVDALPESGRELTPEIAGEDAPHMADVGS